MDTLCLDSKYRYFIIIILEWSMILAIIVALLALSSVVGRLIDEE